MPWLTRLRNSIIQERGLEVLKGRMKPEYRERVIQIGRARRQLITAGPNSDREILVEVARIRAAHPDLHSAAEAKLLIEEYRTALKGIPTWAIVEAREAWLTGKEGNPSFPPRPSELASSAIRRVDMVKNDVHWLARIIRADDRALELPKPETFKKITDGFDQLRADLLANMGKGAPIKGSRK